MTSGSMNLNTSSLPSTNANNAKKSKEPCLKVIPLGGLHEIGKNTCVFEYGDDIMIVDGGLAFPTDGMHGVNGMMNRNIGNNLVIL